LRSEKKLNKRLNNKVSKTLSDADLPGCYDAYVALKGVLTVAAAPPGPGERKNDAKKISPLAGTEYADFATQCPKTVLDTECATAYAGVVAIQVADQDLIDAFVADCAITAPEGDGGDDKKTGDIGSSASNFNAILLLLLLTLTGNFFNS
jgi:hypothetical protein